MGLEATLEQEIQAIGRELAATFPSRAGHPVKALDGKAMELASGDEQLRAALFRFVDVVPACRSLDDLASHLRSYLDEVSERPPPLEAAMRMSGTGSKAGGPDYLLHFVEPRVVTENTMRHGLVVE
ncbi:MAG: hypothetical protein ACR2ML_13620 [Solirubrobacteraceae bacterium]